MREGWGWRFLDGLVIVVLFTYGLTVAGLPYEASVSLGIGVAWVAHMLNPHDKGE